MPDDSRSHEESRPAGQADLVGGILRDQIDVRDRFYEPTLQRLAPERLPPDELITALRDGGEPWSLPRFQGDEGTCGGQALATLIDMERMRDDGAAKYAASARMIYQMARLKERGEEDGVSLRDVIKAFYNYGVCSHTKWPYTPWPEDPGELNVERAQEAKKVTLGAYYRLRPNLNTYHAALHEGGAVLVSAELHDGWRPDAVDAAGGVIIPRDFSDRGALANEKHAFVIVGYTRDGFLVLNSWGPGWGNWRPSKGAEPVPGIALWLYKDWADTIMDGWVLRLGVGAADAFEFSIGDMGLGFGTDAPVRSTPVHAILGNFLHLDDGDFVRSGAFVSTETTLRETLQFLKDDAASDAPYKGVLLTFGGALQGLREATEHVARWKRLVRDAGWYPFTVIWCADYVEQGRTMLETVFTEAQARAGASGPVLDRSIEEGAHGVGRALWRDLDRSARQSARDGGPLHALARAWTALAAHRPAFRLRIVAESEGAFALSALASAMQTPAFAPEAADFFGRLDSVDLVAPPLTDAEYSALAFFLNAGWSRGAPDRRVRVHLPFGRDEKRLAMPPYGRSYFELVRRAFHSRAEAEAGTAPSPIVSTAADGIADKWNAWRDAPRTTLVPITWPARGGPGAQGSIRHVDLIYRSDVGGRLRDTLSSTSAAAPASRAIA